MMIKGKL